MGEWVSEGWKRMKRMKTTQNTPQHNTLCGCVVLLCCVVCLLIVVLCIVKLLFLLLLLSSFALFIAVSQTLSMYHTFMVLCVFCVFACCFVCTHIASVVVVVVVL